MLYLLNRSYNYIKNVFIIVRRWDILGKFDKITQHQSLLQLIELIFRHIQAAQLGNKVMRSVLQGMNAFFFKDIYSENVSQS